ncbi:hypothetical protein D3Y59_06410 [Hymenobacter oligotrophus]|uniref:Uncharacterized protein n=1 Tax=Hymenobacter oligotrophus TaxID=2319843 RepID=A0A3B7R699_9BACT|nr:hypothetical protein [Hymenobacter oligotrophus]AYA36719.1 hypothetical protein D3Y59_06410 [Hymenobacter oligotrophus]
MPYRYRFGFWSLLLVLLIVPMGLRAQSENTAAQNKQLFDRAVDEINFRTMETVYDKSFTRRKYPVTLRTAKARKEFDDYAGRDDLKTLFRNYNSVAERYKQRFGKGRTDLAEFEKQLNSVLVDRNFEFFIRVLPRDERVALIHSLQRYIKQASAQFNASQDPAPEELMADAANVPPADVDAQAEEPTAKPLEDPQPSPEELTEPTPSTRPTGRTFGETAPRPAHDWLDYTTLLCSVFSLALMLYLTMSVIPGMRAQIEALGAQPDYEEETADEPAEGAPKRRTAMVLPTDRYEDDEN